MKSRTILLQWIGHSDLRAMAATLPTVKQRQLLDRIGGGASQAGELGPTKTLWTTQNFDEVRLQSNYPQEWNQWYLKWLNVKSAVVIPVELPKPTDYVAIYRIADAELSKLRQRAAWSDTQLCLHLSPGTPAMAAVWVLLGKTRYPAKFLETFARKPWVTDIPFDLTIDVLPELLRDPDSHLQHLAAEGPQDVAGFEDIAGESRVIRDAVGRAKRAALRGVSILLLGESGTGKEMFAHAIHKASPRRDRPFEAINCAALSKTLLESELFGHVKGAFTGADRDRQGAFELADGGTLFLDEVGECDLETQAKLLRVLKSPSGTSTGSRSGRSPDRAIRRVGDHREIPVDVRMIAATNRDLHKAISAGTFREDLFYRLSVFSITLPPLRERRSDIPQITDRLLTQINRQFEQEEPGYTHKFLSASAKAFVKQQPWPGNVRQLDNVLSQAAVLADGATLGRGDLASALGQLPADGGPHKRRSQVASPSGVSINARYLPCVSSRSMIAAGSHRPYSKFPGFLKPLFPAEFNNADSPSSIGRRHLRVHRSENSP